MDHNANHVIQKCLEVIEQDKVQFMLDAVIQEVLSLNVMEGWSIDRRPLRLSGDSKSYWSLPLI